MMKKIIVAMVLMLGFQMSQAQTVDGLFREFADEEIERRDKVEQVTQIIATLPENQQTVITLRYMQAYTFEEMVRIKDDGQKMTVYMKEEEDARTEYVMIVDSPEDEFVIMIFTGELQPRDVQGLISLE